MGIPKLGEQQQQVPLTRVGEGVGVERGGEPPLTRTAGNEAMVKDFKEIRKGEFKPETFQRLSADAVAADTAKRELVAQRRRAITPSARAKINEGIKMLDTAIKSQSVEKQAEIRQEGLRHSTVKKNLGMKIITTAIMPVAGAAWFAKDALSRPSLNRFREKMGVEKPTFKQNVKKTFERAKTFTQAKFEATKAAFTKLKSSTVKPGAGKPVPKAQPKAHKK